MPDIDADLLALAGDSDDEELNEIAPLSVTPPPHPSEDGPGGHSVESRPSTTQPTKGVAVRKSSARTKHDSEEDGEAVSSPDTFHSAPMSQSNTDASDSDEGEISFPFENQYTSAEDKKRIVGLSEVEREQILADRAAQIEREQQSRTLRQLLKDRERSENKLSEKKKRKADAELEDSQRKTSRQRTNLGGRKVGEASAPLEEYKRRREQRGKDNEQRRREDVGKHSDDDGQAFSDADADGESDDGWDGGKAKSPGPSKAQVPVVETRPVQLHDFDRIKVGHENFAHVCFFPGFEKAIAGCYARINLGPEKPGGKDIYRMALIKGFTEGRSYAMHPSGKQPFVTNQHVTAAMGKAEKTFPFLAFSMSPFTEAEFNRYRTFLEGEGTKLPGLAALESKITDINTLVNRKWTDEEITEKINRSGVKANRFRPIELARLNGRRREAALKGDDEAVAAVDVEITALDQGKLAYGTVLFKKEDDTPKPPSQQERLAQLNRANRKLNTEEIRRAQIAERKADREAAAAVARGEQAPNAFARVKTRAKTHHDVNDPGIAKSRSVLGDLSSDDRSRANTPVGGSRANTPNPLGTPKRSGTPSLKVPGEKTERKGIATFRRRIMDDEAIASLGIELDI
ncbi:MAG: hypothetical protein M1814_005043 [Vezdaea aestivalis]|nr:MAG: hypothetical protein M1814_005043 [Vezdaea aestivalis]